MNIAINKASSAFPAHDDMMCLLVALYCSTLIKVSDHVSHCYNLTAHAQKDIVFKSFAISTNTKQNINTLDIPWNCNFKEFSK